MNHNKIIKCCLKYLNITLGILMVIVLSLNMELIFHNKRIEKSNFNNQNTSLLNSNGEPLNFTIFFHKNKIFFDKCITCSREAINLMTKLNVNGSLLSFFLIFYSFIFAYKINFFVEHHKWLIPICAITQILTFLYFIFAISVELPIVCTSISKLIEKEFNCDADFQYNLENKLIPLSVLMLVLIPQFFVRSVSVLLIKYIYKENRVKVKFLYNNFYTQRTSMVLDENEKGAQSESIDLGNSCSSLSDSFKSKKRKNRKNSNTKDELKSTELKNSLLPPIVFPETDEILQSMHSPNLMGFRELPVDCPVFPNEIPRITPHLGEESSVIEKARREADLAEQYDNLKRILSSNSIEKEDISDEIILKDGNNNICSINSNLIESNQPEMMKTTNNLRLTSIIANTKRFFSRNSSLSTISEEKSLSTLSPNSFRSFRATKSDINIGNNSEINNSNEINGVIEEGDLTLIGPYNGLQVVQTMLNEFQQKNLLISEILQVFEPSSKKGNFNRNIPIRISNVEINEESLPSTKNDKNQLTTSLNTSDFTKSPLTPLYTSALTSIDAVSNQGLYNDLKMFLESSSSLLTSYYSSPNNPRLNAKRTRLLKRLKNRIETKRGKSFHESKKSKFQRDITNNDDGDESQDSIKQHSLVSRKSISPPESASIYSRLNNFRGSLLSFEKVRRFDTNETNLSQMFSINQSIKVSRNNKPQHVEQQSPRISNDTTLILDKNIEPAYF